MFWKRIVIADHEKVIISRRGRVRGILDSGAHRIFLAPGVPLEMERHDTRVALFESEWTEYLLAYRPDLIRRYFVVITTTEVEVGMVYVDGELVKVLPPANCALFWRDAGTVTAELVTVIAEADSLVDSLPV